MASTTRHCFRWPGWMEPVTHYTLSKHIYQPAGVVYSKKFMDALPADLYKVVMGDPFAEAASGRKAVRALRRVDLH